MDTDDIRSPGNPTPDNALPRQREILHRNYFIVGGLAFLGTSLSLYALTGFMLFSIGLRGPMTEIIDYAITHPDPTATSGILSQRDIYNLFGHVLSVTLAPILSLTTGAICSILGIRLLRSAGAATTQVISEQDYSVLGPAIAAGNEQAITQFIRLSSLSGLTGTFTKVGLTGLPLATIFLTIFLGLLGLANAQFFDLAKLTLGAFLGSFVQRQADASGRPPTAHNS